MSPQVALCEVGSRGSSAGGLCRAELAQREVGWTASHWARIAQAGPGPHRLRARDLVERTWIYVSRPRPGFRRPGPRRLDRVRLLAWWRLPCESSAVDASGLVDDAAHGIVATSVPFIPPVPSWVRADRTTSSPSAARVTHPIVGAGGPDRPDDLATRAESVLPQMRASRWTGDPAAQKGGWRISFTLRTSPLPSRSGAMTPFPMSAGAVAPPKDMRQPPFSASPTPRDSDSEASQPEIIPARTRRRPRRPATTTGSPDHPRADPATPRVAPAGAAVGGRAVAEARDTSVRPGVTKVNAGPAARHATLQVS